MKHSELLPRAHTLEQNKPHDLNSGVVPLASVILVVFRVAGANELNERVKHGVRMQRQRTVRNVHHG